MLPEDDEVVMPLCAVAAAAVSIARRSDGYALHLLLLPLAVAAVLVLLPTVDAKVLATQMSPRVVETQYGKLRGVLVTLSNRQLPQVEAYLGLQYASVLGGELRFMPPTSTVEKWDGIRVALRYRPVCPQAPLLDPGELATRMSRSRVEHFARLAPFLERQHEDCLNLNIYIPVRGKLHSFILSFIQAVRLLV